MSYLFSIVLGLSCLVQPLSYPGIHKADISFYSGSSRIKGWLFTPAQTGAGKLPVIVMAPGFSGTKDCNYAPIAEHFAKGGFAVVLFDYPNLGESEGAVPGEVDPWLQVQAYRDALSYASTLEHIDSQRMGVWGGSYSGGHVLVVSALDSRVKCMVALTPFISGGYYAKRMPEKNRNFLTGQFQADRLARVQGGKPVQIPVVSDKAGVFCAIPGANAWNFVESFKQTAPTYRNSVTLKSLEMQLEYEPGTYVTRIDSVPSLFIIAKQDEMIPEPLIVEAYNKTTAPKKLTYIEGYHFSPYMERLTEASEVALEWFMVHL